VAHCGGADYHHGILHDLHGYMVGQVGEEAGQGDGGHIAQARGGVTKSLFTCREAGRRTGSFTGGLQLFLWPRKDRCTGGM
jgi:hypothetical protein